jgi:hypothetical protein
MALLLTTFKYLGQLEVLPEKQDPEHKLLLSQVITKLKEGIVELVGYEKIHALDIDNHSDTVVNEITPTGDILENATFFEIRLIVNTEVTDMNDGGEELYYYVIDDMEMFNPRVTYVHHAGVEPVVKTVIGIDVKNNDVSIEYDDEDEILFASKD